MKGVDEPEEIKRRVNVWIEGTAGSVVILRAQDTRREEISAKSDREICGSVAT